MFILIVLCYSFDIFQCLIRQQGQHQDICSIVINDILQDKLNMEVIILNGYKIKNINDVHLSGH